jgi:hypothetical protein
MKTRVVHVNDQIEGAVYIGRAAPRKGLKASKWANPFKLKHVDRGTAIDMYEDELAEGELSHLKADLHELVGKPLACWCRRDGQPWTAGTWCHGDVLVAMIHELGLEGEGDGA